MVVAQEREDKVTVAGTRWYIVHAYTNFERKVADAIRERAKAGGLDNLFEEIVVPTEEVVEIKRGRKIPTERKFLPGYVLVKMKMTDAAFVMIKNTPKVTGFLGADNKPMPIPEAEAMRIFESGQGGRRAAKADDHLRDRRERQGGRRPVRLVHRHRRGSRRGAFARQGRRFDLRASDAGRAGIYAG